MPRARNIKYGFFQDEEIGALLPIERLAFIGMWTLADFKGCFEFRPKRIKVQLLPYDDCDFEKIAINLDKSGFIRNYSVQGRRYIKIVNFEKHQNPHRNERDSGSEIPDIDKMDIISNEVSVLQNIEINRDKDGTARADSLILIPDSLILIPDSLILIPDSLTLIADKSKSIGHKNPSPTRKKFKPPTIDEIKAYSQVKNLPDEAANFLNYYESNGWKVGKNKMASWTSAYSGWCSRKDQFTTKGAGNGKYELTTAAIESRDF